MKFDVIMAEFSDVRFDARVLKEAKGLAHSGRSVALHMYNTSLAKSRVRVEDNITYYEYAYRSRRAGGGLVNQFRKYSRAIVLLSWINLWIMFHKAAVYHAHNLLFLLPSVIASKLHRGRLVYDAHELHCEHFDRATFKGRWRNNIDEIYERFCLKSCDAFIQASDERARFIADRYGVPLPHVINNYVPLQKADGRPRRIQEELGVDNGNPVMFYSGGIYLGGNRRVDKVLEGLAMVPDVNFVVVGFMNDGIRSSLNEKVESLGIADRVHIVPPCPSDELLQYAGSADFGVIPMAGNSVNTRLSALNKLSEYLMAGLPIICSDYDNLRRTLTENPVGVVGEVFDVESPESVAEAIRKMIADKRYIELRASAFELGQRHMNWENEERKLLEIYENLPGQG